MPTQREPIGYTLFTQYALINEQTGLNTNISKMGLPIISIVLLYRLRRFYAVKHIIPKTCAQA